MIHVSSLRYRVKCSEGEITGVYPEANNLKGSIPSQLAALSELTFALGLDHNQLSGSIPSQLAALSKMMHRFYLESNQPTLGLYSLPVGGPQQVDE